MEKEQLNHETMNSSWKRVASKRLFIGNHVLQQEMTQARQTHVVNLAVLHPRKISFDSNSVISPPCVLCHPGKRE